LDSKKWKTTIITRNQNEDEKSMESFTRIIIEDLKEVYIANYNSGIVRKELSRIYHYYIFGPK
jgi:hypothetical protein